MVKIMNGDSLEVLKLLEDNSIDAIVTDPPYEIGFLNNKWDKTGISYNVNLWKECLRVLKPGGHIIAFSASRTYHKLATAIEEAGFEIRDMIEWVYAEGFPKSLDISKAIDKLDASVVRRERALKFTEWMRATGLTGKEINEATGTRMGGHYLTDKKQPAVATRELFEKIRPLIKIEVPEWVEQMIDERKVESENFKNREVIGEGNRTAYHSSWFGIGKWDITAPATDEAKKWEGWGTQLKPAHEPIVLARKPITEKTIAENVIKYGTGGINIKKCAIGTDIMKTDGKGSGNGKTLIRKDDNFEGGTRKGRHAANFIISEEIAPILNSQQEKSSRYFLNIEQDKETPPFYYCPKASPKERGTINTHPTVKPIKLMKYLIDLITPENGIVLDIFMGSGSTGVAAIKTNKNFIGIELDADYFNIAKERIEKEEEMVNNG